MIAAALHWPGLMPDFADRAGSRSARARLRLARDGGRRRGPHQSREMGGRSDGERFAHRLAALPAPQQRRQQFAARRCEPARTIAGKRRDAGVDRVGIAHARTKLRRAADEGNAKMPREAAVIEQLRHGPGGEKRRVGRDRLAPRHRRRLDQQGWRRAIGGEKGEFERQNLEPAPGGTVAGFMMAPSRSSRMRKGRNRLSAGVPFNASGIVGAARFSFDSIRNHHELRAERGSDAGWRGGQRLRRSFPPCHG